ncbi:MAG: hypothetical protein FWD56_03710 [Bacteroidales bacterium]|nr:hypothetical protein [Bacteroidales bacterium]
MLAFMLACAYIATSMGFGVHICSAEGSSQVKLLAGEAMCEHEHHSSSHDHDHDHEHKACGCDKHDGRCCHTLVYILDKAQNVANQIKIDLPKTILDFIPGVEPNHLPTFCPKNTLAFYERGPGGGLTPLHTPLRL